MSPFGNQSCLHFDFCCRFLLPLFLLGSPAESQEFWPQFRGPGGQGVSLTAHPPLRFSKSDALWSAELPPGHSSPVVFGNRIFLTACEGQKLDCRAYDRATGQLLWTRPVEVESIEKTHPFSNSAAPSPVADSERVIFYIGSYGLLAFSHNGKLAWEKKLPKQVSRGSYGSASSPILCNDLIVLALDTDEGGSRLMAFRRASGEKVWETPRPLFMAGWSTPVLWTKAGQSEICLLGSKKIAAYDPADGKELWSVPGFTMETACSPAVESDHVFACSAGLGGRSTLHFDLPLWSQLIKFDANKDGKVQIEEVPKDFRLVMRSELPENHPGRFLPFNTRDMLAGIDEDKDGAISETECKKAADGFEQSDVPALMAVRPGKFPKPEERVAWTYPRGIPEIPSPVAYKGKLFLIRDGGLLQCMDTQTGTVLYHDRIGAAGGYAASPIVAQDRLYVASQSGTITVIDALGNKLNILAQNPLGEKVTATPALVQNVMYIRTDKHLFAFAEK